MRRAWPTARFRVADTAAGAGGWRRTGSGGPDGHGLTGPGDFAGGGEGATVARWHSERMAQRGAPDEQALGGAPRDTRQRRAVLAALGEMGSFRSAQMIHSSILRGGQRIGLATVYRTLRLLNDAGEVDVVRDDAGEQLFRRCEASQHHHHLVCVSCGTAVEVESAPMERWAEAVGREHGFSEVRHSVEVFGTCPRCARLAGGQAG